MDFSVSKLGCEVFVHHLETVVWSFFNCSASHLLVLHCSARTTFRRLMFSLFDIFIILCIQHVSYWLQRYKNILNITKNSQRYWCKTLIFICFYHNDMWFNHNLSYDIILSYYIYYHFFLLKTGCTCSDLFIFGVLLKKTKSENYRCFLC